MKKEEQSNQEIDTQELTQIQPSSDELSELQDQGYLEDSSAIVGYATRQEQYAAYADISYTTRI